MAEYPNNNFYDPVGSRSNQATGYTYAGNNAQYPSQNSTYQNTTGYAQNYGSGYDNQYASTGQQAQPSTNANTAAAGLSSLSNQTYSQPAANTSSRSNVAYDTSNSTWGTQNYASNTYNSATSRTTANQSPIYATQSSGSTFGRLSLPDQPQSSSNTFAASQNYQATSTTPTAPSSGSGSGSRSYRNAPNSAGYKNTYQPQSQQTQQQPPRYASPLHAVQASQGHNKQPSRTSNHTQPSPQVAARNMQHQRQQSASVEPMPTTVDPSQVYDIRAEREKAARIEAERRRKIEAEQAARKAEEDARQAEEDARKAEEERIEAEARKVEDDARKASEAEAKKKATAERKKEARRKAKEEKQSKTAATALQQMAAGSSSGGGSMDMMAAMMGNMSGPPANDEEAEMRAMFKKMREFNQKNPAMLAKLWEEERKQHAAQDAPGPAQPAQPVQAVQPPAPAPKLTKKQQKAAATAAAAPPAQPVAQVNRPNIALPTKPTKPAQASPSTPAQGSTALWPPHKKGSLAEAAARWLAALPENRNSGKTIDREQILKILDSNPSYVQLCEAIEKNGIRFERSALAKELLKAVPDGLRGGQSGVKAGANAPPMTAVNGTAPQAPASAPPKKKGRPRKDEPGQYSVPGGRGSGAGTVPYSTPSFTSLTAAAREVNSMNTAGGVLPGTVSGSIMTGYTPQPATQDPTFYHPEPMMIDDSPQPSASQPPVVKPEETPQEPPPPPKDKEEAARKRGFGDLVDLTAGDDSDDEPPPKKVFVPSAGPAFGIKPVPSNDGFRQPISYQQFINQNKAPARPPLGYPQNVPPRPMFPPQQTWNGPRAQPPAPVPAQQSRPKGPTEESKQMERIRGKMLVEPIMRDRVARKSKYDSRTIARDVLLATNRHPDMRGLNTHYNVMQKMLGDHGGVVDGAGNKSDLSTIRWDLIDPGEATEEAKSKVKSSSNREGDEDADDENDTTSHAKQRPGTSEGPSELRGKVPNPNFDRKRIGRPRKADRDSSIRVASPNDTSSANEHPELTSDLQPREPRGSPAARRNSTASVYTPKTGVNGRRKASNMSKSAGNTPVVTGPGGTPVGYAAFRQVDENGNIIKKKGRPVGWRKAVHSREAAGLTPKKAGEYEPKTNSKLRQSTGARESSPLVQPHYQVYPCKWRDCKSELDNLEKLKKHTLKDHGKPNSEGDYECHWADCGTGEHIDANGNVGAGDDGVTSFETTDHWFKHVNKAHIQEVAWKLGDGPRGGSVAGEQEKEE